MEREHNPVLKREVIKFLTPRKNENFIDAAAGFLGHSKEILAETAPRGKILAIERDEEIYKIIKEEENNRLIIVNNSYANLKNIAKREKFYPVNGILFDIGFSSWHLGKSGRGFSYQKEEPLDMRYDTEEGEKAMEILNKYPPEELEKIIRNYGEERNAKEISRQIVKSRQEKALITTSDLRKAIEGGEREGSGNRSFAKVFQALRIAVNNELEILKTALPQAIEMLEEKGKIAVISFHSLEDRIVKQFFSQDKEKGRLKIITKKPITPTEQERAKNSRARSAKLRIAQKI